MSIMDLFKTNLNPQGNQGNQGNQSNQQGNQQVQQDNQGQDNIDPNTGQPVKTDGNKSNNPLDNYKDLFDNKDTGEGNDNLPPSFSINPESLKKASSSLDFLRDAPQELMQRAQTGDSKAIMELIQHVGRQSYETALSHSSTLTDKFVGARSEFDAKRVSNSVKSEMTNSALSSIPNANNPAVRKQLTTLATAFQAQNPDASPEQIKDLTLKFIQDLASGVNPNSQGQTGEEDKNGEGTPTDWAAYILGDRKAS